MKNPSQKPASIKRKTVPVMVWVAPSVKAAIQRVAEQERLSVSAVGASLLADAIRHDLHRQNAALLQPLLEQAITTRMAALSSRLASLVVRGLLDAGQSRRLVINLLARQPGMTEQELNAIIDGAAESARIQLTRLTPQLAAVLADLDGWLTTDRSAAGGRP